jgi:drug/metabolite transporter (DMT)-like permease
VSGREGGGDNLVLALLIVIWGTTWAAIRVGLGGIPPLTGVALRFAIAGALLLALAWWRRVPLGRAPHERWLWVVNGLLSFCGSYGIVYWAEQTVPSGLAAVIFSTFPLFVALLAHFWVPGEHLRPAAIAGALLALAGLAVVYLDDFDALGGAAVRHAALVLLLAPLVSAVASVATKRWGSQVPVLSITALPMLLAAVVMGALAFWFERGRPMTFDVVSVGALLYLAVAGSAVTFTLWYRLMARMPVSRLSLIAFLVPVVAVVVGALVFREPITGRLLAGSLLVVAGVGVAVGMPQRGRAPTG